MTMNKYIYVGAIILLSCMGIDAQPLKYQGYPSRSGDIDIRSNFQNPPKGYGNVPFYWWSGDSLKYERLMEQLSILSEASVDGFAVSYVHSHPDVDVELNAHGYGAFGKADAGVPEFYSEDWWKIWNKFSGECAKKSIGLGLDDYVVGWAKNGYYVDEVLRKPGFGDYQGRLNCKGIIVSPGKELNVAVPEHTISIMAYPANADLMKYVANGHLKWKPQSDKDEKVYIVYTTASPELHPDYGKEIVKAYFGRFEEKLDAEGRKGLNYFFQDELGYDLNILSWCEDMRETFKARKGYDILPYLPALWDHIGDITPKIRLDYAQVVTELAEERYFKPIFNWHNERGLIYGCDNNGRGLEPLQYMDYFRAISWFTAPGNDAPARGSSFRQTKVSSSITHMYQRPRTWLEAFHSMGWDSNGEWLTSQLDLHLIAGGNLLCMHGLYYSTHGGWWEWAPPCFHFRMPYWPHMKLWLKYAERMTFVLSQGVHACDIAVLYPTESLQAYPEGDVSLTWKVTDCLSESGLDYDFVDYQSLQKAEIDSKQLLISGEKYKVLILVNAKALHHETLLKIYDFYKKGGIVLAVGELPRATTRVGENDATVESMLNEIFKDKRFSKSDIDNIPAWITNAFTPDFMVQSGKGKVLHRKVGEKDVYMVMNVAKDDEIFFRSKGKVEYWNAEKGTITEVPVLRQTEDGTWIRHNAEFNESKLYVFTPGTPSFDKGKGSEHRMLAETPLEGDWDIEIIPTMNNKWGDFRLPAANELIGPEAREFSYKFVPTKGKISDNELTSLPGSGVYGYAPYMETCNAPSSENLETLLNNLSSQQWEPYCYSWQYGVYDSPGSQGYHGLKGKVDNRFIILDRGGHQIFRTYVYAPKTGSYRVEQEGVKPSFCLLDGKPLNGSSLNMTEGWHQLVLAYANTRREDYALRSQRGNTIDSRQRSAVVFYPADYPEIKKMSTYDSIVAMKWYKTEHLPYSIYKDSPGKWLYQFSTAPGTKALSMQVNGKIDKVWIDGKSVSKRQLKNVSSGVYTLEMDKSHTSGIHTISLSATPDMTCVGPAFFAAPIKLECEGGKIPAGNWSDFGALKFYSGGINYVKEVDWDASKASGQTLLDLGSVNATCQVKVNGEDVDVLMHSPYKVDISSYLKNGKNRIEVLVYSTLSNHYQTTPTAYRGTPISGLLGPVKLVRCE